MTSLVRNTFLTVMASCAILAGPATTAPTPSEITYVAITEPAEHDRVTNDGDYEDNRDGNENGDENGLWGLLGLLGLVGLVGLVRRGRRNEYLAGPADEPSATRYGDK